MRTQLAISTRFPSLKLRVFQTDVDRRFSLLIFAILSTSLYIFHTEFVTQFLNEQLSNCIVQSSRFSVALTINGLNFSCAWYPDLLLILGLLLGELLMFAVAMLIYWFLPILKCRREHLKPLQGGEVSAVYYELEKLRRENIPSVRLQYVRDPLSGENPETFGSMGKYYLSVPNGLILLFFRNQEVFRSIVLHEMSHFYNKDVSKAYFAKAISYSFALIAFMPFMLLLLWSLLPPHSNPIANTQFILSEFWGVFSLATVVFLIYKSILRSREVYADMQSVQWGSSPELMEQILSRTDSGEWSKWQSIVRSHSHPDERRAAIRTPQEVFHLKSWDAFGIGIIFATAFPSIHDTFSMISQFLSAWLLRINYPTEYPDLGTLLLCLFAVPIIGHMIWRARLVTSMDHNQELHGVGRFGLCLAAGMIVGYVASLYFTSFVVYYQPDLQVLLYYLLWTLLLVLGLFGFCRWMALLASLWLGVVNTEKFFRIISTVSFALAGLILAIGLTLFTYYSLLAFGSFLPANADLHTLENPISLRFTAAYILIFAVNFFLNIYVSLVLVSVWMFPLISWFWYRKSTSMQNFQWVIAETASQWHAPIINHRSPFRFNSVAFNAAVGSLLFCAVLLSIHQGLLPLINVALLKTYALAIAFGQLGLAALFQAGIAVIIAIRTHSGRMINGILGAFLGGCVMAAGTFIIYSLLGGALGLSGPNVSDASSIFFLEVNWGTICTFGVVMALESILRFRSNIQSERVTRFQLRTQRKWPLLIFIPCILLLILAVITPKLVAKASVQQPELTPSTNSVKNGDFEKPIVSPNAFTEYNAGQSFGNWTVEAGSIDLIGPAYWVSAHGAQSVDLDGSNAGTFYQNVSTVPGTHYSLSFYLAGNPMCAPALKQMQVWWGSTRVTTLAFDISGHSGTTMGWQSHTYEVQATSASTRLRFVSLTQSACGPALDNVTVIRSPN